MCGSPILGHCWPHSSGSNSGLDEMHPMGGYKVAYGYVATHEVGLSHTFARTASDGVGPIGIRPSLDL
jgi:hypothetical protein